VPKAALVTALVGLAACTARGELDLKRQRWDVERRGLDEKLEQLEERMLADQARVHFWQEMRERHESVSAVACANLGSHAEGIALLEEKQREKLGRLGKKKNRVASRFVPDARRAQ
jgi:hypothetical protein